MTAPTIWPARPVTPRAVTLARLLVVAQVTLGLFTTVMLGFLALLGLAWTTDDGSGPSALALAYTAIFAVSLGLTIALACLTGALRFGAERAATALIAVECAAVLLTVVLLATAGGEDSIGSLMVAPTLYAGLGVTAVVVLMQPAVRAWARGRGPVR